MSRILDSRDAGFDAAFAELVAARREADHDVEADVRAIIAQVRRDGDRALWELTKKFDGFDLDHSGWQIDLSQAQAAFAALDADVAGALMLAAERIRAYHGAQRPVGRDYVDAAGVRLGARWSAVERAGIYIPGGRAAYPSSLLMNAIPAKVAGVDRLIMVTPTPQGVVNPLVLAAAHLAGVDEIWRIGGAQAVAALAFGTESIAPVDVITGPGNAWVAEAKRQVYGVVGIDMVAGPSEIVIVADAQNDPEWIAADLLSQAEHDPTSQSILLTDNADFARAVIAAVEAHLALLATGATAGQSWRDHGAIILVPTLGDAIALVDRLAAEHVELACDDDRAQLLFDQMRHAGSVFLGRYTPEAIGDYVAGPNHVLPTGRRARFASGLAVTDFMKRTSFLQCDAHSVQVIGPAAARLADLEGLPAHALSVRKRLPG
jgi:histidinol dehydrogenase